MVQGAYSLHLYCDSGYEQEAGTVGHNSYLGANPGEIDGESGPECRAIARRQGWIIRGDLAICPHCAPQWRREQRRKHEE